jgi:hypothetical protein
MGEGAGGFNVVVNELREHSKQLQAKKAVPAEVAGLVDQSDVGNKSWGLVGLVVKDNYTSMLGDLKDLLKEMENGLQTAAEKFSGAAEAYQRHDDNSKAALEEIHKLFDDPAAGAPAKPGK